MIIQCSKCSELYEIPDDTNSGASFNCEKCGNLITVPKLSSVVKTSSETSGEFDFKRIICKSCGERIDTENLKPGQEFNCPFCKALNKVGQNLKSDIRLNTVKTAATVYPQGVAVSTTPNPDGSVPQIIGKCKVETLIGSGAMGYVFKATHTTLNIPVAIKVLREEFSYIKKLF